MTQSKRIAVVIVSYKNESETLSYIKKELAFQIGEFIIVVVNNGASEEASIRLASQMNAQLVFDQNVECEPQKNLFVLHSSENLGFAKGNNLGALFVRRRFQVNYILFSNTDIHFVSVDVISKLVDKIASDSNIGVIGPEVIGLNGERQSPEPLLSFWNQYVTKSLGRVFLSPQKWQKKMSCDYTINAQEGYVDKVMGSFFVVNADFFYACGMMDPNTFLYYEELILTERMKKIGKGVFFFPKVTVVHEHGVTIKKYNSMLKMEKINLKSGCYFYRSYKGVSFWQILVVKFLYLSFFYIVALKMRLSK